jgi:flagellar hook-basal body complex protein FliE
MVTAQVATCGGRQPSKPVEFCWMTIAIPMPVNGVSPLAAVPDANTGVPPAPGFLDLVNQALHGVSNAQGQAATAEAGYTIGAPGATLGNALVASDRAEVAWNATVAVRNEVVSAYQSIMNMQF